MNFLYIFILRFKKLLNSNCMVFKSGIIFYQKKANLETAYQNQASSTGAKLFIIYAYLATGSLLAVERFLNNRIKRD